MKKIKLTYDGDYEEQQYWPLLKDFFPNYEMFWQRFIVPFTGRNLPEPHIQIRNDAPPGIKRISIIHYSIFKSCIYIAKNKNCITPANYSEKMLSIYTHFGKVVEFVESLAQEMLRFEYLEKDIENQTNQSSEKLSEEAFMEKAKKFYNKDYEKQYKKFLETGASVFLRLNTRGSGFRDMLGKEKNFKKIERFFDALKAYRNILIHSSIPLFFIKGKNVLASKKETIKKYKDWTSLKENFIEDFVEANKLVESDFIKITAFLEQIWEYFIPKMNDLLELIIEQKIYKSYNSINLTGLPKSVTSNVLHARSGGPILNSTNTLFT